MATKLKLKNVRLAFPDIYEPVEYQKGDNKPRYNATFLINPDSAEDKAIREAIAAEAKATYGVKAEKLLAGMVGNANKYCYLDGDTKDYDGFEGMWFLSSHRRAKDGKVGIYDKVIDPTTGQVAELDQRSGKPYAGCYVNATVEIYAQQGENPGIRCGLIAVQYWADGDAFSGTKRATPDDFAPAEGADAAPLV